MSYELVAFKNTDLAQRIAQQLHKELYVVPIRQFADGELDIHLAEVERYANKAVVLIQSTGGRVNEHTLAISFLAHTIKQAGATKVIAVIPYLGYSRQDRIFEGKPGNMHVIAKLFEQAGIDEIITVALHAKDVMNFFSIPVTDIALHTKIAHLIQKHFSDKQDICLVAPDKGAHFYVRKMAHEIGVGTIICNKERFAADRVRLLDCAIDCEGTVGVMVDDIISTGGTLTNVSRLLTEKGYRNLAAYVVHPILAGDAIERLRAAGVQTLWVSNSMPIASEYKAIPFISVFDISEDIVSVLKKKLDKS